MMKSAQRQNENKKWDRRDLTERLCHALDIAKLAVDQLATKGYSDPKNPAKNIRPEKVISETAVLLTAASAVIAHPEIKTRIQLLAERLLPHARGERMMLGLCLEASVAWDYALPHICLTRLGYADPEFDELLRQSLKSQAHAGRERVPHRILEQEWVAMSWPDPRLPHRSTTSSTARMSILNHPMDLLNGTRDDIYAFTHALMYVTDFNLHPMPLPRNRAVILAEADAVLARCLDEQDYDLSGEVLLSWPLTGKSWSSAAAFAFRVLAHVEDKAAFLPTPSTRISELKALEGIRRTQYLVATAYHTAYVMGLICAASLQREHEPPAMLPSDNVSPGVAQRVLDLIDTDGRSPHWREEFRQLTDQETDALAEFLINVTLRRRFASRDFEGIRALLELAYDLNLANGPAVSQAAEMLHCLAAYARTVSHARQKAVSLAILDRDNDINDSSPSQKSNCGTIGHNTASCTEATIPQSIESPSSCSALDAVTVRAE
jgi:hypothetical protein